MSQEQEVSQISFGITLKGLKLTAGIQHLLNKAILNSSQNKGSYSLQYLAWKVSLKG